jgi:hypothetical protein
MVKAATLAGVFLGCALTSAGQAALEPRAFFKEQMGLNEDQIAGIARGRAIAKLLPSRSPAEIIVVGAVFVKARPEAYVRFALDIDRLRRLPGYLGAGRIQDPPSLSDLENFALEPGDIESLKSCRPGKCGVQLPARSILELRAAVDWSAPDVAARVNDRVRKMAVDIVLNYQKRGNAVLGSYHDSEHPFDVNAQLRSFLLRPEALPAYLPELGRYLLDYPNAALPKSESMFYWERVTFGMKPTLRLNHAVAYQSPGPAGPAHVVAVKQLFASHYFQLALDLSVCVAASGPTGEKGFYLISVRGSTQQGLTGVTGSLLKRIIVYKTRSTHEKALLNVKTILEAKP